MEITVSIKDGATAREIANTLRWQANLIEGLDPKEAAKRENTDTVAPEKKPAKTAKAPKVEEENFDLGFGEEGTETETAAETEEPKVTIKEVIAGFQAFAKAKGRDKAGKILAKYKVKSVHELKPEQYTKVLADIEV